MRLRQMGWMICCLAATATAEVRLPRVLSDHAVLQREQPVRIWGWGAAAEHVTVQFHEQTETTQADGWGSWQVWLKPESAGGPYTLTVIGDATAAPLQRTDILVGDVWIASGQSNMEFPLQGFGPTMLLKDQQKEIAAAAHPNIRLLRQTRNSSPMPLTDSQDTWTACTSETAKTFSAVAYFFGRKIAEEEKVPVGLIDTTWGGTPAQSWISAEGIAWAGLANMPIENAIAERDLARTAEIKNQYAIEDAAALAAGKPALKHPRFSRDRAPFVPTVLFNGMIAPYTNYTIKGAIWYQGETDHDVPNRALYYSRTFPALIQDWRKQWGEGEFPFLYVQISSYGSGEGWGNVRDAQRRTLELANTGMAVTLDVGNPTNIHPPDKQTVGARLAQISLGMVYGKKIETASPMFEQATTEGNGIRAWFSHAEGLKSNDAEIGDFEVAGEDRKFVPATAKIEKLGNRETVLAAAPSVAAPLYVRYGWAGTVKSYLYNASGLPMGTFTSDSDAEMLLQ
jgi:sialate O-acetylesterase